MKDIIERVLSIHLYVQVNIMIEHLTSEENATFIIYTLWTIVYSVHINLMG